MNKVNIHTSINTLLIFCMLTIAIFLITLFVNNDFRWRIIGHIYHKVVTASYNSDVNNSQLSIVSSAEASKCGCPYCCALATQ